MIVKPNVYLQYYFCDLAFHLDLEETRLLLSFLVSATTINFVRSKHMPCKYVSSRTIITLCGSVGRQHATGNNLPY